MAIEVVMNITNNKNKKALPYLLKHSNTI